MQAKNERPDVVPLEKGTGNRTKRMETAEQVQAEQQVENFELVERETQAGENFIALRCTRHTHGGKVLSACAIRGMV
jgi:hypothetical protein